MRALLLGLAILVPSGALASECPPHIGEAPSRMSRAWLDRKPYEGCDPVPASGTKDERDRALLCSVLTACDAEPTRSNFIRGIRPSLGKPIGYKAGLTSQTAQTRFGASQPLLGILFDSMILADGAVVDVGYAARPVWEADLLLVVGGEGINEAQSREDVLAHLRGFRPFIELPDLLYTPETKISASMLEFINVGARLGVAGAERPLPADALTSLAGMRVRAFDGSGALLAEGKGSDALGHPLDVVLWVRDAVRREGGRLKPGDIISVGAFTPLTPPKPGQTVRVRYEGLAGDPEVSVRFR